MACKLIGDLDAIGVANTRHLKRVYREHLPHYNREPIVPHRRKLYVDLCVSGISFMANLNFRGGRRPRNLGGGRKLHWHIKRQSANPTPDIQSGRPRTSLQFGHDTL